MNEGNYIHPSISKAALYRFIKDNVDFGNYFQCVELYENDELMVRYALAPYTCDNISEVYSLSKSFTSTAIGILCDRGVISVEDRLVDLFKESVPDNVSENMKKITVEHLLTMNTGHAACTMHGIYRARDGVRAFMEQNNEYEPGTHFTYNTGASYVLSAIVSKFSGYSLLDFLNINVFRHIGIDGTSWCFCGGRRANAGGAGIHLSADDLAKFGLMYLHGGMAPDGKRIISEKWIEKACTKRTDNSINGDAHWGCGYGYQFWMNTFGGYRGDGAFGQVCMILPQKNIVAVIKSEGRDMVPEMAGLERFMEDMHSTDEEGAVCDIAYKPEKEYPQNIAQAGNIYACDPNPMGFTTVELREFEDRFEMCFSDGQRLQKISAGKGIWLDSRYTARHFLPTLVGLMPSDLREDIRAASCCGLRDGRLAFTVRLLNCPHRETFVFSFDERSIRIDIICERDSSLLEPDARLITGRLIR